MPCAMLTELPLLRHEVLVSGMADQFNAVAEGGELELLQIAAARWRQRFRCGKSHYINSINPNLRAWSRTVPDETS